MGVLHDIESLFGRARDVRWGQRSLDLDLLALGDVVQPDATVFQVWHDLEIEAQKRTAPDRLILPHPRLQERAFVLCPLSDVAADWVHPILGLSVTEMLGRLPKDDVESVVAL